MVARPFRHEAESRQADASTCSSIPSSTAASTTDSKRLQQVLEEPAVERLQVHRAGRRQAQRLPDRHAAGARITRCSNSAADGGRLRGRRTPASASRRRSSGSSSRRSSRPTRAPAASTAAPASGWRSAASSSNLLGGEIQLRQHAGTGQHVHAVTCRCAMPARRPVSRARLRRAQAPCGRAHLGHVPPVRLAERRSRQVPDDRHGHRARRRGRC